MAAPIGFSLMARSDASLFNVSWLFCRGRALGVVADLRLDLVGIRSHTSGVFGIDEGSHH